MAVASLARRAAKPNLGRLGPAVNLRPGGAHKQARDISRAEQKRKAFKEWDF